MKILTINGSPRKDGCCAKLLKKIAEGAREKGGEVVNFQPNKMKIMGCQACMICKKEKRCVINDEMVKIYNAVDESDVIVVGVPIYFHEMSSQLKTVVDRFYSYMNMDANFDFTTTMKKGKKCVLVVPYGNHDKTVYKEYIKSLEDRFKFFGFDDVEIFVASDSMSEHTEYLEKCYNIGLSLSK
ncbi:flavodoxin family protein [Tepidibacter hydrothermalis]|uniref:Flavodoxin family protein n=1 Tax=Tepidibacter hydrothermalis TaxID=3036126 RepID=A0ABY8EBA4_9FIRM|nr:flavodoxin family protein [Tepidibacter hydrothermalis]WFD10222.1 flavodoxin family protein [Tepidibacter hydrothermalis]